MEPPDERLQSLGELAGGLAHDINNLLTVILNATSLASESLSEGHPARADLDQATLAVRSASRLTRQLLGFSRGRPAQPAVLSAAEMISRLQRMLGHRFGRQIRLLAGCQSDLWLVRVDPGQLEQVLMNLLLNARHAIEGSGTITLLASNDRISESVASPMHSTAPGEYVRITVSDTGSGMAPEVRERIFEPWFTTRGGAGGSGLGLTTCAAIIKRAGGTIRVESTPGEGSRFHVLLPRCKATPRRRRRTTTGTWKGPELATAAE